MFETLWTSTSTLTVSTALTQVVYYNNTVVTNVTMIPNTKMNTSELYGTFFADAGPITDMPEWGDGPYAGYALEPGTTFNGSTYTV
jgi:hypothetical protein